MTDNEIIKALEVCAYLEACADCPFGDIEGVDKCMHSMMLNSLDLINRQQAEVEKQSQNFKVLVSDHRTLQQSFDNLKGLYEDEKSKVEKAKEKSIYFAKELQAAKAEVERLKDRNVELFGERNREHQKLKTAKSEAVKEFIKKLKEKKHECGCNYRKKPVYAITEEKIDETYKEMVGDAE